MTTDQITVAYVEWIDSGTVAAGWEPREATIEEARTQYENRIRSAGLLIERNRKYLVLAVMANPHADDVGGAIQIPMRNVTRLDIWKPSQSEEEPR